MEDKHLNNNNETKRTRAVVTRLCSVFPEDIEELELIDFLTLLEDNEKVFH